VIAERAILTDSYTWGYSNKTKTLQQILGLTGDGYYGAGTRVAHVAVLTQRGLSVATVPDAPLTTTTTTRAPRTTTTTRAPRTTTTRGRTGTTDSDYGTYMDGIGEGTGSSWSTGTTDSDYGTYMDGIGEGTGSGWSVDSDSGAYMD